MSFELLRRGCLHHISGRRLFASRGDAILTGLAGEPLRVLAKLPLGGLASLGASVRLLGRLFRHHVYHIASFQDRLIVLAFGRAWCIDANDGRLLGAPAPLVGARPLALCVTPHGLYYGEYVSNPQRRPVRVLFSRNGLTWEVVREFRGVRHIHGVYYDASTAAIWVTTGDDDEESVIWRTTDAFQSLDAIIFGSQQTRAIALLFTDAYVYFGSDTPNERNHLYRWDRGTGQLTRLVEVEGSVFHAARVDSWLLFSTAVEPSKANPSRHAALYASNDGESWRTIARHAKDRWPMKYYQYGQLILPSGHNETGRVWYSTFAVRRDYGVFSGTPDEQ